MSMRIQTSQEFAECLAAGPLADVQFPCNANILWVEQTATKSTLELIEAVGAGCGRSVHLR